MRQHIVIELQRNFAFRPAGGDEPADVLERFLGDALRALDARDLLGRFDRPQGKKQGVERVVRHKLQRQQRLRVPSEFGKAHARRFDADAPHAHFRKQRPQLPGVRALQHNLAVLCLGLCRLQIAAVRYKHGAFPAHKQKPVACGKFGKIPAVFRRHQQRAVQRFALAQQRLQSFNLHTHRTRAAFRRPPR